MRIILSAIFSIFISGCVSITVVSSDPNFSAFISGPIVLKKPVLVCEDAGLNTKSKGSVSYRLLYNINNISSCPFGKTIGKLPVGKDIYVSSIEKHRASGLKSATKVYFVGATSLSGLGEFNFYYLYGHEGHYENQPW
jgi:hypothetical protein